MIKVKLPDGSIAQFPDGTSSEDMKAAIQKKFPPKNKTSEVQPSAAQPDAVQQAQPTGYDASLPAQIGSGLYEGATDIVGAPVDLVNMGLRAGAAGVHALGGPDIQFPVEPIGGSQSIRNALGSTFIKPQTNDGTTQFLRGAARNMVATVAPMAGEIAASATPARAAASLAASSLGGSVGSAAAGYLADKAGMGPDAKNAVQALGNIGGTVATMGVLKGVQKLITPFEIDPRRAAMNDIMQNEGVELTAGQKTGNKPLQYIESELGGGPANAQAEQYTKAVLNRANIAGDAATPDVLNNARQMLGQQFDDLAARNPLQADQTLATDMQSVWKKYEQNTNSNTRPPLVENILRGIANKAFVPQSGGGFSYAQLPGSFYNQQMSDLNEAIRSASGQELNALQRTKSLLDNAMERSMVAAGSPDIGAFQQARRDWRNLLIIQDAVGGAGEAAANGIITPAKLRAAIGSDNYALGRGDLSDLARAGVATMTPLPNSGTTPRALVHAVPAALGSVAGAAMHGVEGASLGGTAGFLAPYAIEPAMFSGRGQRYLANQAYTGPLIGPRALVGPAIGSMAQFTSAESTAAPQNIPQITVRGANPLPPS